MRLRLPVPPEALSGLSEAVAQGLAILPQLQVDVDVSGIDEIKKNVRLLSSDMLRQAREEARRAAEWLQNQSLGFVPYLTGMLYDSSYLRSEERREGKELWIGE